MADTSIRGWVMAWGDEAPRRQLPVRNLEAELVPAVAPLPLQGAPTALGRKRGASIQARRRMCAACAAEREVEGTGYCARGACVALRDTIARASRDGGEDE